METNSVPTTVGLPGSPIIPLTAPLMQNQQQNQQQASASSQSGAPAANKPKATLPLPVILPLTVSIPPSAPLTPPATRGRARRRGRQPGSGRGGKTTATSPVTIPLSPAPSPPVGGLRSPIPSIAVSPAARPSLANAPLNRPLTAQEVQQVEGLIERCLHLYMNQEEVVMALQLQANIAPNITRHVWQGMESKNPDFFRAYDVRLKIKEQITAFNYLVSQQAQVTETAKPAPNTTSPASSSTTTSSNPFLLNMAPLGTVGGLNNGFQPLPSPFGMPSAPIPVDSSSSSGPVILNSSLSSLLTAVQIPSGSLSPSRESALTLSTNSLINSFLNASSDGLVGSAPSDPLSVPSDMVSSSSTFAPSLSFAFGPTPASGSSVSTISSSAPASHLIDPPSVISGSASAPASLLLALPGQSNSAPLLSSGAFATPFISVDSMDSVATPFSPFTPFTTPSATIIGPSTSTATSPSTLSTSPTIPRSSAMAVPSTSRSASLLGSTGGSNFLLSTSPNSLGVAGISPLSTSPSDAASFLTSSISSIPLTASTNALLAAISSFGGESPLRQSTSSTTPAPQAPPLNTSLEGLFPDAFLGSTALGDEASSRSSSAD